MSTPTKRTSVNPTAGTDRPEAHDEISHHEPAHLHLPASIHHVPTTDHDESDIPVTDHHNHSHHTHSHDRGQLH